MGGKFYMQKIRRGDVFFANLSPTLGSEQSGEMRPVVIIQNDIGNAFSPTLIVAAITQSSKRQLPTHVQLYGADFIANNSIVLLEQIRTIDRMRLRRYIGTLDSYTMNKIDIALAISVGLKNYMNKDYFQK